MAGYFCVEVLHENVEGIVPVVYQSTTVQKPSPLYHSVNHPQHAKGVAAQSDVFPQSRHRLIEEYYYHCYLLVDLFDCRVHETVIRHLPIYGQAISRSRFLVQREQFHFLLPRSQRCSLASAYAFPCNSRYVPSFAIHQETWNPAWEAGNESPGKRTRAGTLRNLGRVFTKGEPDLPWNP